MGVPSDLMRAMIAPTPSFSFRACLLVPTLILLASPAMAAPPAGLEAAKRAAERDPDDPEAIRQLVDLSQEAGGLAALTAEYGKRAETAPADGKSRLLYAELLRMSGRCDEAASQYSKASELLPKAAAPYRGIANCHRTAERWDEAVGAFQEAAARARGKAETVRVNRELLSAALAGERLKAATGAYRAIVATAPRDKFLRVELARTFTNAGRNSLAKMAWKDVLSMAGSDQKLKVLAVRELGQVLGRLAEYDAAIAVHRDALAELPAEHWAVFELQEGLISVYRNQGRLEVYIKTLEKRRSAYPVLLLLAQLYEEVGDDRKALAAYRTAVKKRPANVDAQASLLRILKRIGTR
ncbi:MAG: tetratricopeptide (TPR) repeat protein, partial [Myxococcota bacterium]